MTVLFDVAFGCGMLLVLVGALGMVIAFRHRAEPPRDDDDLMAVADAVREDEVAP